MARLKVVHISSSSLSFHITENDVLRSEVLDEARLDFGISVLVKEHQREQGVGAGTFFAQG